MRLTVLWYFRFHLSLRSLAEIMLSRGIDVSHQTISRWIKRLGPDIGKEARTHWNNRRTISWYVDETYIKVKGEWKYLYRAIDKNGETLDVMLSSNRNKKVARKFFRKALKFLKESPNEFIQIRIKPMQNQ